MALDFTEDEFHGRLDWRMWLSVLKRAMRYPRNVAALGCVAVMSAIGDASFAPLTRMVIDEATQHGLGPRLWMWVAAYMIMVSSLCFFVWLFIYNAGKISRYLSHDIRKECFDKLQDLPFAYFDARPVGWLMSRITSDCDRLAQIIAWGLTDLLWGCCIIGLMTGLMLLVQWKLALIVIAVTLPLVLVSRWFQKHILLTSRQVRKMHSMITASYNEAIMGIRTTKTLVREADNLAEFSDLSRQMLGHSMRGATLSAVYLPLITTTGSIAAGLVLWTGGASAMAGAISLGTLVMFIHYATQFFGPIGQMAKIITEMQGAQAAGERVLSLLNTIPAIKDSDEVVERIRKAGSGFGVPSSEAQSIRSNHTRDDWAARNPEPGTPNPELQTHPLALDGHPDRLDAIEFRNVSFAYANGKPVLTDFNLQVSPGETIALVGPTGGGKSTIVSLVCRFYEPTHGQVLIDGIDYRERSLHWLQSSLGIVLQAPHLFSGTIADNIRYGKLDATQPQVEEAARLVHAHEFIATLEKGYDTQVGEGGNRLSTGQKQLVSFARAILARPRVFVMDEATSSIDTNTEHLIQKGLEVMLEGRISFVIAHRLSTIRAADRILVIEAGRIAEIGSHRELIQKRGKYFELYTSHSKMERETMVFENAYRG
jgi:ATP-binding cassette subfamily B protein